MAKYIVTVRQVFTRNVIVEMPDGFDPDYDGHEAIDAASEAVRTAEQGSFFDPSAQIVTGDNRGVPTFDNAWDAGDDIDYELDEVPLDDDSYPLDWWKDRGYPVAAVVKS